jgi:hypothetical protein
MKHVKTRATIAELYRARALGGIAWENYMALG